MSKEIFGGITYLVSLPRSAEPWQDVCRECLGTPRRSAWTSRKVVCGSRCSSLSLPAHAFPCAPTGSTSSVLPQ